MKSRFLRKPLVSSPAGLLFGWLLSVSAVSFADTFELFNGKDFSNWYGSTTISADGYASASEDQKAKWNAEIEKHWRIEGNEVVNDGSGAYLTTSQEFGDFDFSFEYKIVKDCDSGIYLRGIPQVQIWDPDSPGTKPHGGEKGSGGLWNNPAGWPGKDPLVRADNPVGEWNTMKIRLIGEHCWVWLNDYLVVDNARLHNYFGGNKGEPLPKTGPIKLQTHGAEIRFRNMVVNTFSSEESNKLLAEADETFYGADKFVNLFNGYDLSGWAGAVDNYKVVDGAIQCLKGKGGVLHTEGVYSDFLFRVEFQLPPAGNNGLAIRYPTKEEFEAMPEGKRNYDAAYVGMCELQVLDDGHEAYKNIDPRQAHGSAYGMVAAKRGYLRPQGDWNYQLVQVQGSKIRVELNGTQILDADLSKVEEFMANTPHPGKDRTSGHVGFAGHSDPVKFRNISILPLK